jgi:monofunctional biosynthetic peptidoglycan transglycosylase
LIKRFCIYLLKGVLLLALLAELMVLALRWIDPPIWSWRIHRAWFPPTSYPEQIEHQWVALTSINKSMPLAVVAAEDQRFLAHYGVDFLAIWRAYKSNREGGRLRGGSTITQQTAKNLWLWPSQSYWRKAVEFGFAGLLELNLSKSRILELYLNIAEFGPGIYGVEAASQHYFNLSSEQLSAHQAASLAALLPSPYRYSISPKSAFMSQRVAWIRQQMRQLGPL